MFQSRRQFIFAKIINRLLHLPGRLISLGMANRWAFESLGRALPLDARTGGPTLAPYAHAFTGPALTGWLVLAASAAVLTAATVRVLRHRS